MQDSLVVRIAAAAAAATAIAAVATVGQFWPFSSYAEVVDVKPAISTFTTLRERCRGDQLTRQKPGKNEHRVADDRHCETVCVNHEKQMGYDVRYWLNGKLMLVRMDHDPGSRIPVRDGKPVVNDAKG
jgi:uncharacterized protein YcfJ